MGERPDSNRRPPGPQPGALPTELRSPRGSNVAPWVGLAAVGTCPEEVLGRRALNRVEPRVARAPEGTRGGQPLLVRAQRAFPPDIGWGSATPNKGCSHFGRP